MKKLSVKNYLLTAFFALLIVVMIWISVVSGSVKYFGFFVIALAIVFAMVNTLQRTNHEHFNHFRSKSREQLLRHQFRK